MFNAMIKLTDRTAPVYLVFTCIMMGSQGQEQHIQARSEQGLDQSDDTPSPGPHTSWLLIWKWCQRQTNSQTCSVALAPTEYRILSDETWQEVTLPPFAAGAADISPFSRVHTA